VHGNGDIAFAYGNDLLAVNPKLPGVRGIWSCPAADCSIYQAAWSPDGRSVAFVQGYFGGPDERKSHMSLYVMAVGGEPKRLASCSSCGRGWGAQLGWSPNGKWIAYARDAVQGPVYRETIWLIPSAGGKPHPLTHCRTHCVDVHPSWSPNGRLLAYAHLTLGTRRHPNRGSARIYTVRPNGSHRIAIASGANPQWSPDGRHIVFDNYRRGIEVANANGSHVRLLYPQTGGNGPGVASWSPDGQKLAFFNTPLEQGHNTAEVWTINADGSDLQRLYRSDLLGDFAAPIWSPDGTMIAFANLATYVMNADGSGLTQLTPTGPDGPDPSSMSWQQLP
jgi:Tol biopolymer transport system component